MKKLLYTLCIVSLLAGCSQPIRSILKKEQIDYLTRKDWGAKPPVMPMPKHQPRRITIHHTATLQMPDKPLSEKMRGLQKFSQEVSPLADGRTKQAWADIPYHLYVDVHGKVAEGRDRKYAGDSNTSYDPSGHLLIVLEGNFEKEDVSPKQLRTLEVLLRAMGKYYEIPGDSLSGHKDFAQTSCPGNALYLQLPYLQKVMAGH